MREGGRQAGREGGREGGMINAHSPSPMRFCCMKGATRDDVSWPLFLRASVIVSGLNMHGSMTTSFSG